MAIAEAPVHFAIIGAQKSGTTSLHRYLQQHPDILLPEPTELDLYGSDITPPDTFYSWPPQKLTSTQIVGYSYVGLLFLPGSAPRLHRHSPSCKLIAILREPVSRAYSAFWHHRRIGWEKAASFEEALQRELGLFAPQSPQDYATMYMRNGKYADLLEPFLALFSADNIFLLTTDELKDKPHSVLRKLLRWLGVRNENFSFDLTAIHNPAALPRWPRLTSLLNAPPATPWKRFYYRITPIIIRRFFRSLVAIPVNRALLPFRYPPMNDATKKFLSQYYSAPNRRLRSLLGTNLPPWLR